MRPDESIKELAEFMHTKYEEYAQKTGWDTNPSCKVVFDNLPEANKKAMLMVSEAILHKFIGGH